MNVEIGTEAGKFLFWKYINGIFVTLHHAAYKPTLYAALTSPTAGGNE
jgi:hypothetical protein